MKSKFLLVCLVFLLVIGLLMVACTKQAPAPGSASTLTPTQVSASKLEEVKPIELKFANYHNPPAYENKYGHELWARMVEDATQHRVKITIYPGGTLVKSQDEWAAVQKGICDITDLATAFSPGLFDLTEIVGLPMIGLKTAQQGQRVAEHLYQMFPEIRAEWASVKFLSYWICTPSAIGTNKRIRTMEDLNGTKLRVLAGPGTILAKKMGIVPIMVPGPQTYENVERGIVDGFISPWSSTSANKLYEVTKYYLDCGFQSATSAIIMNREKFNSLPIDIQQAIEKVSATAGTTIYADMSTASAGAGVYMALKAGREVTTLPKEEQARWEKQGAEVADEYAAGLEAKGRPAKAILAEMRKFMPTVELW